VQQIEYDTKMNNKYRLRCTCSWHEERQTSIYAKAIPEQCCRSRS